MTTTKLAYLGFAALLTALVIQVAFADSVKKKVANIMLGLSFSWLVFKQVLKAKEGGVVVLPPLPPAPPPNQELLDEIENIPQIPEPHAPPTGDHEPNPDHVEFIDHVSSASRIVPDDP